MSTVNTASVSDSGKRLATYLAPQIVATQNVLDGDLDQFIEGSLKQGV